MSMSARITLLVAFVAAVCAVAGLRFLPIDDFDRHARSIGLSRSEYLHSLELYGKAREGRLSKSEWPEFRAMAASRNAWLRETGEVGMIGVARFGPCRREALALLGTRLNDLRIAYAADAPDWRQKVDKGLHSGNARLIKTANWILAAEKKRLAGDSRFAMF